MASTLPANGKIRLAVVTGGHPYEVPPLCELFRSLEGIDAYPQSLDEFTADAETAAAYDVVLFYTMHQFRRDAELPWYQANIFATLEQLGRAGQGICVLHHSLVAFPEWPLWSELTGIANRSDIATHLDQRVPLALVDAGHPIVRGIGDWTLTDEIYEMDSPRPEDGNRLLLTTSHPKSMAGIAWTRMFRESRVLCWQSGHDHSAFRDANFRRMLGNGIRWLAEC